MSISRNTSRKHPAVKLQGTFSQVLLTCVLIAAFLPVDSGTFIPTASALEQKQQENFQTAQVHLTPREQQKVLEKNTRIRKLQEGIIDQKIKILSSKKKERNLLAELEAIEKELRDQKQLLADLKTESEKQEALLAEKQKHLSGVLKEKKAHQVHVKKRLAAFYRMGSAGLMNVLFSTESLPELLDFKEYFSIMVKHDQAIIQKYLAQIWESNRAREDHARAKLRLMKMSIELGEKEKLLNETRQEKNVLLKRVNTEQHLYEQAVSEIEEAVADLATTLKRVQTSTEVQPGEGSPPDVETEKKKLPQTVEVPEGFPGQKGFLEPPVKGIVTTLFGQKVKGKFDSSTISNGIDIRVHEGVEITAVYGGKVIHSGYLRGYGNLIIIDHGQQYFSLISRAAEFYKKEGAKVKKGGIIGIAGEGDSLYGEGIHFEIRKGANSEDPLLWLKKDSLPLAVPPSSE